MRHITIKFKPSFIREFKKLPQALQDEAREKIHLFKDESNHQDLRVHKLKGRLRTYHSFSVNYSYRIVFEWESKTTAVLLMIGTHDVYN